jgi:L-lactate utilization protein LutB
VITPQLQGIEKAAKLPFASSLCGACRDVCPVKIDLPRLLLHLRARALAAARPVRGVGGWRERLAFRAWAWVMTSPARYRAAMVLARCTQPAVGTRGSAPSCARSCRLSVRGRTRVTCDPWRGAPSASGGRRKSAGEPRRGREASRCRCDHGPCT